MSEKNVIKVVIDGRTVSLGGYESSDYLERVAFYINNKIAEMHDLPGYKRQKPEMKSVMLALNIADDYFKAKSRADAMEQDLENKDEDTYAVKQDLVAAQVKIQKLERQIAAYKETYKPRQIEMDVEEGSRPAMLKSEMPENENEGSIATSMQSEAAESTTAEKSVQTQTAESIAQVVTAEKSVQPEKTETVKQGNNKYQKRSKRYMEKFRTEH